MDWTRIFPGIYHGFDHENKMKLELPVQAHSQAGAWEREYVLPPLRGLYYFIVKQRHDAYQQPLCLYTSLDIAYN
ncbi:MAG TPA: hypothetical protein VJ440_05155 [Candidatus Brocadiaceae bacterium]|nr:hypothetical protein [Candidatus Brocadiaceae bacterium]